ncbi:phosphodiester glycosidase family protein [Rhodanobacter sp. AS-Z3]|uniref:phosphodiester glycosidase family protein n=1 Tax=Rhodanobacter sp. AS-Z3 TaxID=3031330 RepID=UPI0024790142|nr:phosphodiester glycosidase family protein [Rhodanobacter sp. AS-Z3]WEN14458.1 phosphodiester glycosidase family protein [Rhodanobacter sp. AS-Z3]
MSSHIPRLPHPPRLRRLLHLLLPLVLLAVVPGCAPTAQALDSSDVAFDGQNYRIVHVDLKRENLSLHWRDPTSGQPFGSIETLRQWGEARGQRLLFAANAGIYDHKFAPLGLYVEDGKTLVPLNLAHGNPASGNFSLLPNGVFAVYPDGHAAVRTSEAFKADGQAARWATQSGPMLLIDGKLNEQFVDDSASLKWRSGVCARTSTDVVFAASEAPVNFHTFGRLFRDKLGCRNALYLDGSISQLYVDGQGYAGAPAFMVKPYAGIFAVFAKP